MGRRSKKNRPPAIVLGVIADNVMKLRDVRYSALPNETQRNRKLAEDSYTTLSQIQRVTKMELAAGADMIENLANALGVRPQDLLTPYFANAREGDTTTPFFAPTKNLTKNPNALLQVKK